MPKELFAGIAASSHTAEATGLYTFSGVQLNFVNGLIKHHPNKDFIVYPNPASSSFSIPNPAHEMVRLELFSISGKLVYANTDNSKTMVVSTVDCTPGIYLLRAQSTSTQYTAKVVIEKQR